MFHALLNFILDGVDFGFRFYMLVGDYVFGFLFAIQEKENESQCFGEIDKEIEKEREKEERRGRYENNLVFCKKSGQRNLARNKGLNVSGLSRIIKRILITKVLITCVLRGGVLILVKQIRRTLGGVLFTTTSIPTVFRKFIVVKVAVGRRGVNIGLIVEQIISLALNGGFFV